MGPKSPQDRPWALHLVGQSVCELVSSSSSPLGLRPPSLLSGVQATLSPLLPTSASCEPAVGEPVAGLVGLWLPSMVMPQVLGAPGLVPALSGGGH